MNRPKHWGWIPLLGLACGAVAVYGRLAAPTEPAVIPETAGTV